MRGDFKDEARRFEDLDRIAQTKAEANLYAVALIDCVPEDGAPESLLIIAGEEAGTPNPRGVLNLLIAGGLFDRGSDHLITRGPRYAEVKAMVDASNPPCPQCGKGRGTIDPDGARFLGLFRQGRKVAWFKCWRPECAHAFPAEVRDA